MKIQQISISLVKIPFRFSIDHQLKNRTSSESLLLSFRTAEGLVGYGEGAPRDYVTGETYASLKNIFLEQVPRILKGEITSLADIERCSRLLKNEHQAPSLACALEMTLLDLWGQRHKLPLMQIWGKTEPLELKYSGVAPYMPLAKQARLLELIQALRLHQIKLKVGYPDDWERLQQVREVLGSEVDIRLDANRAWTYEQAQHHIPRLEEFRISCVEEPLLAEQIERLPELSRQVSCPLMLDESVYTLEQARHYAERIAPEKLYFNLKISKSGGLLSAASLYQFAHSQGIACQLGCNVGETALLSAAGRIFAQSHALRYVEGSYAPFFMADDISSEAFGFSPGGKAKPVQEPGLGVRIDPEKLKRYQNELSTLLID